MKSLALNVVVGLASLTSLVTGAATPQPDAAPIAIAASAVDTGALIKRESNGANCWRYKDSFASYWRIVTWGPWDDDWGQGLIDNLHGQCTGLGPVQDWAFWYEAGAPPTNGDASFTLIRDMYDDHCVLDAIWLASNGAAGGGGAIWGAECWESDHWW